MDDIYQENIIDHYKNPRCFGELPGFTHKGRGANASCGDMVEIYLTIQEEKITGISFQGIGCALSTAAASMLAEKVKAEKLTIDQVKSLKIENLVKLLGIEISPTRMKCVVLPLKVLQESLE